LARISHYIYAGDTALHIAAAAYNDEVARTLLAAGADIHARNRHGQQPIHYAVMGVPGSGAWDPARQFITVSSLLAAGADPNAADKRGVTPLHRAVRSCCAAAVKALLERGADPSRKNSSGSTPMFLATTNTGRGGSGLPEAKAEREEILRLLARHGAG
jgi:ankyrin repeat protein